MSTLPPPRPVRPGAAPGAPQGAATGIAERVLPKGALVLALALGLGGAASAAGLPAELTESVQHQIRSLVQQTLDHAGARLGGPMRVDVQVGAVDARLKLAPCGQVQAYWPGGQRVLALARAGLRCVQGPVRWNVFVPVTVRLWRPSLVAAANLPAGTLLNASHLREAEVDLLARPDAALSDPAMVLGRALAQALTAGQALRVGDLRLRQWVRPGDSVRVLAGGPGFMISGEGQALAPALEGQPVRVRIDGGRILQGVATAERQVTVPL